MLRALGSFADFFISPSFTTVAKWIGVISATSFFAGYVLGYFSGHRREIAEMVSSVRGGAQSANDAGGERFER